MIVEYELSNPYVQGISEGWCSNWNQGSDQDPGDSSWIDLTEEQCWQHCNEDFSCFQVGPFSGKYPLFFINAGQSFKVCSHLLKIKEVEGLGTI